MSVSELKKMIDPYLGSLKTLPHDVAVKAIESAKDEGEVTPGESAKLFDALRFKPVDKFEVAGDRQALGKAAVSEAATSAKFDALSFSEKRRMTNSIFNSRLDSEPAGKVGTYSVTKSVPMPANMKYTDALVSLGFPLKAAQQTAKYVAQFRRDSDPDAKVTCRLVKLGGKVVATEAFADGAGVSLLLRFSPDGEQYMRHTPWID